MLLSKKAEKIFDVYMLLSVQMPLCPAMTIHPDWKRNRLLFLERSAAQHLAAFP